VAFCRAMRQGAPQIRHGGDDNIGNFPVAIIIRLRETYLNSLTY
jgi:hypothetical protein